MEGKYKLTDETIVHNGRTLYRIEALKDFGDVKAGDKGGYVQSESNLSQEGDCWVYDEAKVYNEAMVYENAKIYVEAEVFGEAEAYGNAIIHNVARIYGLSKVFGMSIIS